MGQDPIGVRSAFCTLRASTLPRELNKGEAVRIEQEVAMSVTTKHAIARRVFLPIALAAITLALGAAPASATTTEHVMRVVGPESADFPAGTLCDFAYHQEASYTQNLTRFFDADGNLVSVIDEVDITVVHTNVDTDYSLTEEDHYAAHVDLVSGIAHLTGQSWHLRTADGRLVLSGAGLIIDDIFTQGEFTQTPHAFADFPATICPALGGAPA
jgi:hypothetical protein